MTEPSRESELARQVDDVFTLADEIAMLFAPGWKERAARRFGAVNDLPE